MSKALLPLLMIVSFAAVIMLQMGFIFIMLALLPSLVAYFVDRDPLLSVFKTVLACNMAAILPVIYPMLQAASHFKSYDSFSVLSNPMNWLIAYGGAAAGWGLIFLCRVIANFVMTLVYEYRIVALERLQKKLVEEWGQDIRHKKA